MDDDIYEGYHIPKGSLSLCGSRASLTVFPVCRCNSVGECVVRPQRAVQPRHHFDVLTHARAISQDPIKFPEPEKFKPERFLQEQSASADEPSFAFGFGFGRRVWYASRVIFVSVGY